MIGELFTINGNNVWYPHVQNIIDNYNTRPQRGLIAAGKKMTPALVGEKEDELIHAAR